MPEDNKLIRGSGPIRARTDNLASSIEFFRNAYAQKTMDLKVGRDQYEASRQTRREIKKLMIVFRESNEDHPAFQYPLDLLDSEQAEKVGVSGQLYPNTDMQTATDVQDSQWDSDSSIDSENEDSDQCLDSESDSDRKLKKLKLPNRSIAGYFPFSCAQLDAAIEHQTERNSRLKEDLEALKANNSRKNPNNNSCNSMTLNMMDNMNRQNVSAGRPPTTVCPIKGNNVAPGPGPGTAAVPVTTVIPTQQNQNWNHNHVNQSGPGSINLSQYQSLSQQNQPAVTTLGQLNGTSMGYNNVNNLNMVNTSTPQKRFYGGAAASALVQNQNHNQPSPGMHGTGNSNLNATFHHSSRPNGISGLSTRTPTRSLSSTMKMRSYLTASGGQKSNTTGND